MEAVTDAAPPPTTAPLPMPTTCVQHLRSRCATTLAGRDALCVEWRLAGLGYSLIGPDDWFGVSSVLAVKPTSGPMACLTTGSSSRTTGRRLGIWIDRWPHSPSQAKRQAAEAGLPANSGTGRRVVYDRSQQRVWAVEADGTVVKSHAGVGPPARALRGHVLRVLALDVHVLDRQPGREVALHGPLRLRAQGGRIGFHEIPTKFGVPLQSESQLGQPLSGGCVRQSTPDAQWMWDWAQVGTKVVVL